MHLDTGHEAARYDTPPGRSTVGGMAFDWTTQTIWATQMTSNGTVMFEFHPATGAIAYDTVRDYDDTGSTSPTRPIRRSTSAISRSDQRGSAT